jgi:uncharacterized protein (DUF924 family)
VSPPEAAAILDFWFLPKDDPKHGQSRMEWWQKKVEFDDSIRTQFGPLIERVLSGEQKPWPEAAKDARVALAWIILLDQFTRNIYRGSGRSFAGDPLALAASKALLANKDLYESLSPYERSFVLMPLEHSEVLADQEEVIQRFEALAPDFTKQGAQKAGEMLLDYAKQHHVIVARFGRFPHRNALLGRQSTEEEIEFLKQPGSSF